MLISSGVLKKGEQLPSLRQLSAELSINVNTVKRALSELEMRGIIYTVPGKGTFIDGENGKTDVFLGTALDKVKQSVINAKAYGAKKEDLVKIIDNIYKGDDGND